MAKIFRLSFIIICFVSVKLYGQDSLPKIAAINRGGVVIISWKNGYKRPVSTINIQRSFDSIKNFTSIGTVLNPQNTDNGYADVNPPYRKMYYRVFVGFEGGKYVFSETRRPKIDNNNAVEDNKQNRIIDSLERIEAIRKADSLQRVINPKASMWMASRNVYSAKDNNILINLPDAYLKKYSAKFFESDSTFIFELTKIPEPYLILDKVNFLHSGWFYFELYESGKMIERNKFYVPKDGRITNSPGELNKKNKP